jgi:hypothetical protein
MFLCLRLIRAFSGFLRKIGATMFPKISLNTLRECIVTATEIEPVLLSLYRSRKLRLTTVGDPPR